MPIKLSDVLSKTTTACVPYGDESILLEIRTNVEGNVVYAIGERASASEKMTTAEQRAFFIDTMLVYLKGWDILDDDGGVLPITAESIGRLPQPLVYAMFDVIKDNIGPNPTTAPTSAPGSAPTESKDESPAGTPSSNGQSTLALPRGIS